MIIQILAAANFLLGCYDAWLTQHRIKAFGKGFELNRLIKGLSTLLGPQFAALIGVLVPVVGWTYIFTYFNLLWALALMVGFNAKRFEMQLSSRVFEKQATAMKKMMDEIGRTEATLPSSELTDKDARSNFEGDK
jgi:hypothetical protein